MDGKKVLAYLKSIGLDPKTLATVQAAMTAAQQAASDANNPQPPADAAAAAQDAASSLKTKLRPILLFLLPLDQQVPLLAPHLPLRQLPLRAMDRIREFLVS